MRITDVLLGLLLLLCVACDNTEKVTERGLKYKLLKKGTGKVPQKDDVLVFNFKMIDSNDSVWTDTYKVGMPGAILVQDTSTMKYEDDMMNLLRTVSVGDSIAVTFTMRDFYAKLVRRARPSNLDSTMTITYALRVDSITTREIAMKMQKEIGERLQKEQIQKDLAAIDQHLAANNIEAQKTDELRYVIKVPGKGENIKTGQVVKVNYVGTLLDGTCFDTSDKEMAQARGVYMEGRPYEPYQVTIDRSRVIQGWHQALKLLNKGAKATFYIPSSLAYGPQEKGPIIKANSNLVFDMEIVEVKDVENEK